MRATVGQRLAALEARAAARAAMTPPVRRLTPQEVLEGINGLRERALAGDAGAFLRLKNVKAIFDRAKGVRGA